VAELDPALVDRAVAEATRRTANFDYFFDALTSPDWIEPLAERRMFSEPPKQTIDEGYVRAPGWSASRYLARMAADAPEKVLRVIRSIETNNERVHEDFINAALAMPLEYSRMVALAEAEFLASRDYVYYLLPRKAAALATHMADLGDTEVALQLFRSLFIPSPVVRDEGFGIKRPQSRISDWEYDDLLRGLVEKLVTVAPRELLRELLRLLGQVLDLLRPEEADDAHFDLLSRIWRVRIADDRDRATRIEASLVSAVRDAAREAHANRLLTDVELVELLTARPEELLRRIAMDALSREPEPDLEVVRQLVVDPEGLVDEPSVEQRELLAANAARLPRGDIKKLVEAIHTRPDVDHYRKRMAEALEREPTNEEIERYVASWRVSRLELLLAGLDPSERAEYEALRAVAPDAKLPVSFEVRTFSGSRSPFTIEELNQLQDHELLELLRSWEPADNRPTTPSTEGLARALAAFAQHDPARVAALALDLRDMRPAFVQWAFEGLEVALREGRSFDWAPVIELAKWVVEQPREIPGGRGDDYADLDPGWVWTRREIVSLLEKGFDLDDDRTIPLDQRSATWSVINAVAEDADPTPESEERYGGSNMDPLTLALNTTRPRALFAAMSYGSWIKRAFGERSGSGLLSSEAPELAELLERHLDPAADSSVAVRAAIANHYVTLFVLDANWARERQTLIFPDEDSPLREAAWGAYVIYTSPFNDVLAALREVYERSAELAGAPGHGFRWDTAPQARLGEHLASFYWSGTIGLDDPLLGTFWREATSEIRRHVVDFLGRSVADYPELDEPARDRLLRFWDFAHNEAVESGSVDELAPFAWWVKSEALPRKWRINNLLEILREGVKPDPAYAVMEGLPALALEAPAPTVEALRQLLEVERTSWSFDSWDEQIEQVLQTALTSDDPDARRLAEETTNWLGALGYRQYRGLLR
jgi:hypothetical protein